MEPERGETPEKHDPLTWTGMGQDRLSKTFSIDHPGTVYGYNLHGASQGLLRGCFGIVFSCKPSLLLWFVQVGDLYRPELFASRSLHVEAYSR